MALKVRDHAPHGIEAQLSTVAQVARSGDTYSRAASVELRTQLEAALRGCGYRRRRAQVEISALLGSLELAVDRRLIEPQIPPLRLADEWHYDSSEASLSTSPGSSTSASTSRPVR